MKLSDFRYTSVLGATLLALGLLCSAAEANNIGYKPLSPTFGGSPNNADWIAFSQHTQNRTPSDGAEGGGLPDINLPDFEELFKGIGDLPTIIIPIY